jgi:hypothetical protein
MRQIEKEMLRAIGERTNWRKDNTEVCVAKVNDRRIMSIYLHGNHIADIRVNGSVETNLDTLADWPTPTTKSRLRALGVNLTQKAGVISIDGEAVCNV